MASIFTYDPDPPRVSSPWLISSDDASSQIPTPSLTPNTSPTPALLSEYGVTKLEAEPQQGPTEYKLHLLLRPRRKYAFMSTFQQRHGGIHVSKAPPAASVASSQPRHERLKHLTTQLLWRLQQSSPFHASSSRELSIPQLTQDSLDTTAPVTLEALVPGLEESRGALYEIGVSDDGTLVGLTRDEMNDSITTLRIMAASLGCIVDVLRVVIVGDCEWLESTDSLDNVCSAQAYETRKDNLWVVEAFVTPHVSLRKGQQTGDMVAGTPDMLAIPNRGSSTTPQLRVTLTGPITSGKSSLLGTLSTDTLDNGRGKSRLSLLKHRHEMVSGFTSSIAQELIGYKEHTILNFSSHSNIDSWLDIHDCAGKGRIVFVSDSGGHPRYRRTVLRGLMSWAPHWSILCIAAEAAEESPKGIGATRSAQTVVGAAAAGIDLAKAHLALSLKLDVPMAVVITKLDLASKQSLQETMSKVLTAIKEAGRLPKILQPDQKQHDELDRIPPEDHAKAQGVAEAIIQSGSLTSYVPIVLTSTVKGIGIGLVHALLESLPLPPPPTSRDFVGNALDPEQPKCLFHIDDTFSLASAYIALVSSKDYPTGQGIVASGHLRFGSLSVGDSIVIGPFQQNNKSLELSMGDRPASDSYGLSISHPSSAELARIAQKNAVAASAVRGEWHKAKVVSIRNLRLPVRTLDAGQAGSIGFVFDGDAAGPGSTDIASQVRRGMVLAVPSRHMLDTGHSLQAASGFTATFAEAGAESLIIGSLVNVYMASVRAAARVLGVSQAPDRDEAQQTMNSEEGIFGLAKEADGIEYQSPGTAREVEVSLELLHSREWIEMGSKVILLEGGSQDRSGLEGYVGRVVEIVD
ncbi:hypothetical protein CDD82_5495 [Ophiocordyceps australis]|uniref:Tr-type G domain-containing protein n=1 Tax=Ophiocordyceps australis TaxID=1399860 RepID=A0A2C5YXA7_9HYPO|nr:hypothetical protein CDD82_5495 [Ophiocordyceps australis]